MSPQGRPAIGIKGRPVETTRGVDRDQLEFWSGAALLALAGVTLFAPLILAARYTLLLLVVGVLGLAAGAVLIGLSRRGRAV